MLLTPEALAQMFASLRPHLTERQRRLVAAAEGRALGWGGVTAAAGAAGLSRPTVQKAMKELDSPAPALAPIRSRRPGGGRKRAVVKDPGLLQALERLVDPHTRGDPESPLRWTSKSTRQLARALTEAGHPVSHKRVAEILRGLGYSLQSTRKAKEGTSHPDRDAQFVYLSRQIRRHLGAGEPVISVDTKKKELVGEYKNAGREWQPKKRPEAVSIYDFPDPEVPKAVPYGVYDVGANAGWVSVGCDHDTASFAVQAIRRWWEGMGQGAYRDARRLLICADCGGSNGYRLRLWKWELSAFSEETGLAVTVCHLPPGTSKWNKVEHRLFSYISMNWRGRPLTSYEVIVQLIGATTTQGGLEVRAELDSRTYPTKLKVADEDLAAVRLRPHKFHGEWNYTIRGRRQP